MISLKDVFLAIDSEFEDNEMHREIACAFINDLELDEE